MLVNLLCYFDVLFAFIVVWFALRLLVLDLLFAFGMLVVGLAVSFGCLNLVLRYLCWIVCCWWFV